MIISVEINVQNQHIVDRSEWGGYTGGKDIPIQ